MPSLLRLADSHWPCSRADLEQANPLTTFPPDLADAQPLDEFGFILPEPTPVPPYDPLTHRAVEVRPIEGQDGIWRQAWEVEAVPPPPPAPDWAQLRTALRNENGYSNAFSAALQADPMVASSLASRLDLFETTGQWGMFLDALLAALAALPAQEADYVALEFLALAHRCNLPGEFLATLEGLLDS